MKKKIEKLYDRIDWNTSVIGLDVDDSSIDYYDLDAEYACIDYNL